jgi:Nucleotide-sugar transporter.
MESLQFALFIAITNKIIIFSLFQVFSLGVLLFGIVLIQIDESASESISRKSDNGNQLIGFGQVILASVSSG